MIVLISGYAGSGKDEAGKVFIEHDYIKLAFADMLKDQVAEKYKIDRDQLDSQEFKRTFFEPEQKTVRQILIDHGLSRREEDPYYWVKRVDAHINMNDNYVITDCRMSNEIDYFVKKYGKANVKTVRIQRFDKPYIDSVTETSLDTFNFDYYIINKNGIDSFRDSVMQVIDMINYKGCENLFDSLKIAINKNPSLFSNKKRKLY